MNIFNLKIISANDIFASKIFLIDNGQSVELTYKDDKLEFSAADSYPFFALVKIRLELEKHHIFILCNGSRIDVYPSGMSASGLMAYELIMGKQATKLVNILEPFNDVNLINTVENQKDFRKQWLKSFKPPAHE